MTAPLSPDHWEKVQRLFNEVVDLDAEARAARLDEACHDDPALREDVEALLKSHSEDDAEERDREEGLPASYPAPPRVHTGTTISHYKILEKLGGGGMGVVYKARDTKLDRLVALKFLPPHLNTNDEAKQRFIQEAKAASTLDHPNICTIHDISETQEGQLFIAMAYYQGETLKKKISRGPLPVEEALEYAVQIARGLARAHEADIVHRDVKPANIMVTDRGLAKIVDFGVAKAATDIGLTKTGTTIGTAAYMSPEQARGVGVDTRTDIWALGVVLYEMLTGQRPFKGDYEQATIYWILNEEPQPIREIRPEVPESVAQIVDTLLSKTVTERYQTMNEVLEALGAPPGTSSMTSLRVSPVAARPSRVGRWALAVGAALLAALVGVWALWPFGSPPSPQTGIAVLPFVVDGDQTLDYLETGMVTLLSAKIDGVGELRSVDANTLIGYLKRNPDQVLDPQQGQAVAAHFGAGSYILGRIIKVGGPIEITASLYDHDGTPQTSASVSITADSLLLGAVDNLARQLISRQFTGPGQQLASMATLTSSSFAALRAFLEGEEAMRDGSWVPAFQAFQRAVEADSTFAMAWYRLATAADWGSNPREVTFDASAQAMRHSDGLPDRTRTLIQAQHAYVNGRAEEAEELNRSLTTTDPNNVVAWYQLGETRYHFNRRYGRPTSEAQFPLERALALDPDNEEIRHHLVELAAEEERFEGFDTLAAGYIEALEASEQAHHRAEALSWRVLPALASDNRATREQALDQLEQADWLATWFALDRVNAYLEDLAVAQRLAEQLTTLTDDPRAQASGYMRMGNFNVVHGRELAARGAYAKADSIQPSWQMILLNYRAQGFHLLYAYRRSNLETLRDEIAQWDSTGAPLMSGKHAIIQSYLLGLTNWRMSEIEAVEAHMADLDRYDATHPDDSLAYSLARTLEGLVAWQQGDAGGALNALDTARLRFPVSTYDRGFYDEPLVRYLRAEILFEAERFEEALPWYASLDDGGIPEEAREGVFYLGPSYLRRAQIYEALDEVDNAIDFYTRFVNLWQDCEPELRPQVEAAQGRLDRLLEGILHEPG